MLDNWHQATFNKSDLDYKSSMKNHGFLSRVINATEIKNFNKRCMKCLYMVPPDRDPITIKIRTQAPQAHECS